MDPVLLEILLDGVTKYLSGTKQTKYIVGSKGKKKPDYWDRIRKVNGNTPENEEHEYWQLQRNQEPLVKITYCEASSPKTGGKSMEFTIEN